MIITLGRGGDSGKPSNGIRIGVKLYTKCRLKWLWTLVSFTETNDEKKGITKL